MRGEELVNQVTMAERDFEGVETSFPDAARGSAERRHDLADLFAVERAGRDLPGRAGDCGRRYRPRRADQLGIGSLSGVIDVSHDVPAGGVHGINQLPEASNEFVVVDAELRWQLPAVQHHVHRFGGQ